MKEKKSGKIFAVAQQIGKSLFLPIAILPAAGILLGIGSSFSNEATIAVYGLTNVLHAGSFLYSMMVLFKVVGQAIFDNLPLIFALAVALGMAKKEKGVAVLSAGIFYLIMMTTISWFLNLNGAIVDGVVSDTVKSGAITTMLGIQTLNMGVFGGIITGLITAAICNKFYNKELPSALSFFSGTRLVPIMSMVFAILTGILFYLIWPPIQNGIYALGGLVTHSGYVGTFIYGCIERALVPFGLHHIFYMPFWQSGLGGTAVIDGVTVMGAQNIFFAELASPNTTHFSVEACRFLTGKFPFMMGGLPGAALAMYVCAKDEKKKQVGALLFSAALTSFLTGITEPIEFTFLFLAPLLYGVHVLFAGLAFALCHILQICVGTTFSNGLIDFLLYGVLPGQAKSNWMMLIPLLVGYFVLYFLVFRFAIKKWDLKTPGRGADDEEDRLYTKADYLEAIASAKYMEPKFLKSARILYALGGIKNILEVDCCATRLRLTVVDSSKVDEAILKKTGASGVIIGEDAVQVIYGPSVTIVKSNLEELIEKIQSGIYKESEIIKELEKSGKEAKKTDERETAMPEKEKIDIVDEKAECPEKKRIIISSPVCGMAIPMNEVKDEVFASGTMGEGLAIEPSEGKVFAPADATVASIFETKHCICLITDDGVEMLIHIGIDTVKLEGRPFETHVFADQKVKKGDLLISFNMDMIKKAGLLVTTPVIVCNTFAYQSVKPLVSGAVKAGEDFLELISAS